MSPADQQATSSRVHRPDRPHELRSWPTLPGRGRSCTDTPVDQVLFLPPPPRTVTTRTHPPPPGAKHPSRGEAGSLDQGPARNTLPRSRFLSSAALRSPSRPYPTRKALTPPRIASQAVGRTAGGGVATPELRTQCQYSAAHVATSPAPGPPRAGSVGGMRAPHRLRPLRRPTLRLLFPWRPAAAPGQFRSLAPDAAWLRSRRTPLPGANLSATLVERWTSTALAPAPARRGPAQETARPLRIGPGGPSVTLSPRAGCSAARKPPLPHPPLGWNCGRRLVG